MLNPHVPTIGARHVHYECLWDVVRVAQPYWYSVPVEDLVDICSHFHLRKSNRSGIEDEMRVLHSPWRLLGVSV